MKKSYRSSVLIILIGMFCFLWGIQSVQAGSPDGKIDPFLQSVLNTSADNDFVSAYVVLQDRLSLAELQNMTYGLTRKERQKAVVQILKDHARVTQQNVLSYLRSQENAGNVKEIRVIWAINVIGFEAVPSVVYDLASDYNEVESVFYNAQPPLEEILDDQGIARENREQGKYFSSRADNPGLALINAPLVWAEGDSGQGVLVANIDTGSDWHHPDLANQVWNNLGEDADGDGRTMEWNGSTWVFDPGDINNIDDDGNGYVDDFKIGRAHV